MLALKRRLFGAPHDAPTVPEEGPSRHRRKQTDPKRVRRSACASLCQESTTLRPLTKHRHSISLLQAISCDPERRLPDSTPQQASMLSSVPTSSSALSPVSQPPPSGSSVSSVSVVIHAQDVKAVRLMVRSSSQDQDVDTPVAEPSTSDPAYVPDESTIDTGSDDSERSITLVSEATEVRSGSHDLSDVPVVESG